MHRHPERKFQNAILKYAYKNGWYGYCHPDSRKSASISTPGFPDIILMKPGYFYVIETKRRYNKAHDEQIVWLTLFQDTQSRLRGTNTVTGVFYPSDWSLLKKLLKEDNIATH